MWVNKGRSQRLLQSTSAVRRAGHSCHFFHGIYSSNSLWLSHHLPSLRPPAQLPLLHLHRLPSCQLSPMYSTTIAATVSQATTATVSRPLNRQKHTCARHSYILTVILLMMSLLRLVMNTTRSLLTMIMIILIVIVDITTRACKVTEVTVF